MQLDKNRGSWSMLKQLYASRIFVACTVPCSHSPVKHKVARASQFPGRASDWTSYQLSSCSSHLTAKDIFRKIMLVSQGKKQNKQKLTPNLLQHIILCWFINTQSVLALLQVLPDQMQLNCHTTQLLLFFNTFPISEELIESWSCL